MCICMYAYIYIYIYTYLHQTLTWLHFFYIVSCQTKRKDEDKGNDKGSYEIEKGRRTSNGRVRRRIKYKNTNKGVET